MACTHNQALINANNAKIAQLESDISDLETTIGDCNSQIINYRDYGKNIDCVISNLEGNVIQAGQTYDQGTMTESKQMVEKTIDNYTEIIKQCDARIDECTTSINALKRENVALNGDCDACKEKAAYEALLYSYKEK